MTKQRLLAFFRHLVRAWEHVNPVNRSGFQSREGNLSEDTGDDFAAWVVCRGRAFWDGLRPSSFQQYLDEFFQPNQWNVRPDYLAGRIYDERFGEDVWDVLRNPVARGLKRTSRALLLNRFTGNCASGSPMSWLFSPTP